MARPALTFARFLATPENRAAWLAVQDVATGLHGFAPGADAPGFRGPHAPRTLLLIGPPGTGKTHLVQALIDEATRQRSDIIVTVLAAAELARIPEPTLFTAKNEKLHAPDALPLDEARHCDLLIVEDLQHLNPTAAEMLVHVIDYLQACGRSMVFTANAGLGRLAHRGQRLPVRLTSRLAAGLVVALEPLGPVSRLTLLQTLAQRRQLAVPTEVMRWLADRLTGGGRQLEGAIAQLESLVKIHRGPLDLPTVQHHFQEQASAGAATVERIVEQVSEYFHVDAKELQSQKRTRHVLVPRQVGMYLARKLTGLSFEKIGAHFGGRDHTTVLHACRKVEISARHDASLSGALRNLGSVLT